tara:strand:- start:2950 stop:4077 length:1128 start_codon:yes stop_codon:yes gene_type:complete
MIPYGKQTISKRDIKSVNKALKGKYLTTGPIVERFENEFSKKVKSKFAVSCSNGTAALHLAFLAAGIKENDIIIVPVVNFVSTINLLTMIKAKIFCADVDKFTGRMTPETLKKCIKVNKIKKIKAVVVMHNGGSVEYFREFFKLRKKYDFLLIEDACHALGSHYPNTNFPIGSCKFSDIATFSFHPVKSITTAEGGMVTTNNFKISQKLILLKNHGIFRKKSSKKKYEWSYKILFPGFNYRLSDLNSALGLSQLKDLKFFVSKRQKIAKYYVKFFQKSDQVNSKNFDKSSAYHLFIVNFKKNLRNQIIQKLYKKNIITQVHYIPAYKHPYYKKKIKGKFKNAEIYYNTSLSLPIFPDLKINQLKKICKLIKKICF